MSTFVLIHGAASDSAYWHLVEPELRARGHDTVAVDLPCEDDGAGLADYADAVVEATGERRDLVLVAQSLGGFTAPLVADRVPVELIVLVAAMIPLPGETGMQWWEHTGHTRTPHIDIDDPVEAFLHDVPPETLEVVLAHPRRDQSTTPMYEPWPLERWPDVPTRFVLCTEDRFFPAGWMRGVVEERLGLAPDELESGHCPALARPRELAERLHSYVC